MTPAWPADFLEKRFGNSATLLFSAFQKWKKRGHHQPNVTHLSHPWHGQSAKTLDMGLEMRRGKVILEMLQKGKFERGL